MSAMLTCTHHNDQQRADCPVCVVAKLRADCDYNHECINRLAVATGTLGEKSEKVVEVALSIIDQLRAELELWEAKCHELIAPHYIIDPCLRAAKFREALAFHPVIRKPKKEGEK